MTFVHHVIAGSAPEGCAAVTADGRTFATSKANPHQRQRISDNVTKLAVICDKVVIATTGATRFGSVAQELATYAVHREVTDCAAAGDGEGVAAALSRCVGTETIVSVTYWFAEAERPEIIVINGCERGIGGLAKWRRVKFPPTTPEAQRGLGHFPLSYGETATRLLDGVHLPLASYTLNEAVALSRFCVQVTADLQALSLCDATVGGQLTTACVTAGADGRGSAKIIEQPQIELKQYGLAALGTVAA